MIKYALTGIFTNLICGETQSERDYTLGNVEFALKQWETNRIVQYFGYVQIYIKLNKLPAEIQNQFFAFHDALINYTKEQLNA